MKDSTNEWFLLYKNQPFLRERLVLMELPGNEVISAIAESHSVSSAQVILRWNLQKGVVIIPSSGNPNHTKENTDLYGFTLTDAEMEQINALDRSEKHDCYQQARKTK